MPRKKRGEVPSLRRHKCGQGIVTLNGHDHYLGVWPVEQEKEPAEVRSAYDRIIAEWLAGGRKPLARPGQNGGKGSRAAGAPQEIPAGITVAELCLAYMKHAAEYYRHLDGTRTGEVANVQYSLRPLNHLYGTLPARALRPKRLKAVRLLMVKGYEHPEYGAQKALARKHLNSRIARIVRMFKWAAEEELVPEKVWLRLTTVTPLHAGRSQARETEDVKPVAWADVEKTLPHLRPQPAAAARLMWLSGMRSGEALPLCADDLDRSGPLWVFRPGQHKSRHRGKDRIVLFGPKAQGVLLEFIKIRCAICGIVGRPPRLHSPDGALCSCCAHKMKQQGVCGPWPRIEVQTDRPLFSPQDEQAERFEDLREKRKTPVQPSQKSRKKARAKRKPGLTYSVTNFQNAVKRACRKAGIPEWHPHQLRHAHGTAVRKRFGLEGAQVALGHAKADVTQLYAERDSELLAQVAREIG